MRLTRRATPVAPAETTPGDPSVPPPPPTAPRGAPVAAFAGVLDGRHLWLAIEERPGALALRRPGGEVVALDSEVPTDQQVGYTSVRADLGALPGARDGDGETAYDVVLVPGGGRRAAPVWSPPLTLPPPAALDDGRTRFSLLRDADGFLRLRRRAAPDAAHLVVLHADAAGVTLTIDAAAAPATAMALLADDGTVLATRPLVGQGEVVVDVDLVTSLEPQLTHVVVGEPDAWRPVRRRRNDLADPARGAPLPELTHPATGEPALRLRWTGQGALTLRVLERAAP